MKILKCFEPSNRTQSVYNLVMEYLETNANLDEFKTSVYLERYRNGRENGYLFVTNSFEDECVTFTEGRNHDSIVIYNGKMENRYDNYFLTDDTYKNGKSEYSIEKAADLIVEEIIKNLSKCK